MGKNIKFMETLYTPGSYFLSTNSTNSFMDRNDHFPQNPDDQLSRGPPQPQPQPQPSLKQPRDHAEDCGENMPILGTHIHISLHTC